MTRTVLTFDIGTSSVKAGVFLRDNGSALWLHREDLPADHARSVWESERWIRAIQASLDQVPSECEFEAICLSGNGPTIVPVGSDGAVFDQTMLWLDPREKRVGGEVSFFLPKIAWVQAHEPLAYERTWMFMTCPEFVAYLLSGTPHTTTASDDFSPYVWDAKGIERYGIDACKLPPLVRPGDQVGVTGRRAEQLFGVGQAIPVIGGGPDFLMSLLGTAAVKVGRTCDRAGTSEGINHCSANATRNPTVRCLPHVVPGLYNVAGVLSSTGRIFEWFRRISRQQSVGYERMLSEIIQSGIEDEPFFFPSVHEGAAWEFSKGMFVGLRADHATAEMGRGVVHSIGYAVRQSVSTLQGAGCDVSELRACGGQAKNPLWNQLKADITGVTVSRPQVLDAELVGCLCCALVGLGDFSNTWEAAGELVRMVEAFDPDPAKTELFEAGYQRYLDAYQRFTSALAWQESL